MFNPVTTDLPYEPADGVQADVGELAIRDLVLVGGGGDAAIVSGAAINLGMEPITLQLAPQAQGGGAGAGTEIEVGPREQLDLSKEGLRFEGLETKPGSIVPISVSTNGGTTIVNVPVLPATGAYSTVTPAAPASTPTSTSTTSEPTATTSTTTSTSTASPTSS
jgi:hypothetical protein